MKKEGAMRRLFRRFICLFTGHSAAVPPSVPDDHTFYLIYASFPSGGVGLNACKKCGTLYCEVLDEAEAEKVWVDSGSAVPEGA